MIKRVFLTDPNAMIFCGLAGLLRGIRAQVGASTAVRIGKVEVGPKRNLREATFIVTEVQRVGLNDGSDTVLWKVTVEVEVIPSVSEGSIKLEAGINVP